MARFKELAELAEWLAAESSRLKKRAAIAEAIVRVHAEDPEDAGLFAMYLAGTPFAEADSRKAPLSRSEGWCRRPKLRTGPAPRVRSED